MAKKNSTRSKKKEDNNRPQNPDEFLLIENETAAQPIPKKEVISEESRVIHICSPTEGFDAQKFIRQSKKSTEWELSLPAGAGLVQPGKDYGRMSAAEITRNTKKGMSQKDRSEPFRPPWVDYIPHAKVTAKSVPLLRRINGQKIEPHYGVFGADNRQVYYPTGYPWTCIGKILVWDDFSKPFPAWSGSGVLIGGRVVLTAGHMAPWGSNNWAMQFIPAFYNGASVLGSGVSSWVSNYYGYDTGNSVSAWDMLVLRLYTPLGNTYGYFGTKDYSSSWEGGNYWTLAGYPSAIASGNRPSRQMWWPVLDDDSDGNAEEVEYEADATAGNSGGPVFGFWNGLPYAIATHSGGSKTTFLWWTLEDTNVGAGGGALNSLVAWARSNWP